MVQSVNWYANLGRQPSRPLNGYLSTDCPVATIKQHLDANKQESVVLYLLRQRGSRSNYHLKQRFSPCAFRCVRLCLQMSPDVSKVSLLAPILLHVCHLCASMLVTACCLGSSAASHPVCAKVLDEVGREYEGALGCQGNSRARSNTFTICTGSILCLSDFVY